MSVLDVYKRQGEIPCYKVAEDDRFFAFLDINPLVKGHTLVIPKQEVDYIFDLNDEDLAAMHEMCIRDRPRIPLNGASSKQYSPSFQRRYS